VADEPVSALDPALADAAIAQLMAHSESSGATLIASLHAVDLALKWFPRVIGMRAGEVVFDLPRRDVSREMLAELYATEGGLLPTQANAPLVLAVGGSAGGPAVLSFGRTSRPGCR